MILDFTPLERWANASERFRLRDLDDNLQRTWHRSRQRGTISERAADTICIKHLGVQPELLWPELLQ